MKRHLQKREIAIKKDLAHFAKALPTWMDSSSITLSGELLMKMGLHLPYMPPQTAVLLNCIEIKA